MKDMVICAQFWHWFGCDKIREIHITNSEKYTLRNKRNTNKYPGMVMCAQSWHRFGCDSIPGYYCGWHPAPPSPFIILIFSSPPLSQDMRTPVSTAVFMFWEAAEEKIKYVYTLFSKQ